MGTFTTNFCTFRTALSVGTKWCNLFCKGCSFEYVMYFFVFIQEDMCAGVAVELWDTCFLIWFNCFCGFNAGLYLASEASKMHEILQRPLEHLNARVCQIEHDFVNLWQRYWPNTTSCRVNTETMCVCDFTFKIECHSSFMYAYILLKHLNITLQLILLLDSAHIVFWWL